MAASEGSGVRRPTAWWQRGTVYQVYPRSFQDTNGDGVGDLRGITARLDYLAWLGIDAVWISPIFPSPMADFGYDVADYCGIDPLFGTLEDFDALVAQAHRRRLKVILDFVPNHTSIAHPWFQEARASRQSPRRDWYIWRDPAPGGGPPNNWLSNFGGPAWTFDAASGQYYYHAFLREQPDLNWRNPAVRAAMHDVLRFWLDRGVDGFRVDVIWHLIKDEGFRDNPANPDFLAHEPEINRFTQVYSADRPEVFDVISEMRRVLDAYEERVLIGEIYLPIERLVAYYGPNLDCADLPFNFQLIQTPWRADAVAELVQNYEAALPEGGWPNWVLGNHDRPRIAARIGPDQARIAAILLLTLRGTPTLYYGDEIGLGHVPIPPERVQDPWERNEPGHGRDPERTPMQWDDGDNAGFSDAEPWLPLSNDYRTRNVDSLRDASGSILTLYRILLALRREHAALAEGAYRTCQEGVDGVFAYERYDAVATFRIVLNFTDEDRICALPDGAAWTVLLCSHGGRGGDRIDGRTALRPSEGLVLLRADAAG
ncbi:MULTISPECIES: alpha-amylase family glycosyl hydrolase [Methylobacterium]|uniref:Oligo-1,6-glucosidase n=2 Tax=Pseudomonadota TaxID=1224 RepID=A0ABQ4SV82_9HYPH|nr:MULTISPECIES: alpha-amylase family glycosyl hydrolase [Methylobacterium]PIU04905.1 MAG: alpha-amylase [Methylobacterium sp. CG09_land_8_20_14_0_10_71_15]PIU12864.1 MAG: alpha-amylase [Methylobacterium sp. CG08_land_8_20_14_0_20_71_15]GBU17546.1 trehalose-6-P hydrolase [Methylobacterium sp.]GJE07106.1 Oligo-1,6-glucosidase [Methylobacterium jeotgali]